MGNKPFLLSPCGKDYLWGGNRLREEFHKEISMSPLAETWECSVHPDGPSVVVSGKHKGQLLSDVLMEHPHYLGTHPRDGLPVLVKLIDASQNLSIQVHPTDEYANMYEKGACGKTEMWYVLDAKPGAELIFGCSQDMSLEDMRTGLEEGSIEKYLRKVPVVKDDVFFMPAGTIHAIGEGVLLAEIQQSSNLTYRLYDYDRLDPSTGQKRPIHPELVYDNVNIPDTSTEFVMYPSAREYGVDITRYWDQPGVYTLMRLQVEEKGRFRHDRFAFYTCVKGEGTINGVPISIGETVLVPEGIGWLDIEGNVDLFLASYRNEN